MFLLTTTPAGVGRMVLVGLLLAAVAGVCGEPLVTHYANPLDVSIADPQILDDGGTYYLYGTSYDPGFGVFSSTDLVNWRRRGIAWRPTADSWAQSDFWAPEVIRAGDTYYLFYTAKNTASGRRNVCVAASASPLGPFVDVTTPIFPVSRSYIDGHPYQDPVSGKTYLFAVEDGPAPSRIVAAELSSPPVARTGPITEVLTVTQAWEGDWVEAPFIIRHGGSYYMMYSGSWFWENKYSVGYSTATNLLGPWTKSAANPVITQTATVSGPGHNSIVASPDGSELFTAYHTHLNFAGGGQRQLAIDRLSFTPVAGQPDRLALEQGHPTTDLQPYPSGAAPHLYGVSDSFDSGVFHRDRWNIFGEESANWKMEYGQLVIQTQAGDISNDALNARNIFLQYVPPGDFTAETRFTFSPTANYEQAFLILWDSQSNFIRFGCVYANGNKIETGIDADGVYSASMANNSFGSYLRLKVQRTGNSVRMFAGAGAATSWTQIGPARAFESLQPQVGFGALVPGSGAHKEARFDYFNLSYPSRISDWALY